MSPSGGWELAVEDGLTEFPCAVCDVHILLSVVIFLVVGCAG